MSQRSTRKRLRGFPAPIPANKSKLAEALQISANRLILCRKGETFKFSTPMIRRTRYLDEGPFVVALGAVTAKAGGCKTNRSGYDCEVAVVIGNAEISDAQFAAEMHMKNSPMGGPVSELDRLYIWPGCDIPRLAAFLVSMKMQLVASTDYSIGLVDVTAARKWIQKEFGIRADENADCPFVGDYPIFFDSLSDTGFPGVDEYVSRHGRKLFDPFLGPRQKSYLAAMENCKKAKQHILKHYHVVAYSQGEKKLMKFGYKGEELLTPFNSFYIAKDEPMHCLQSLILKHSDLWEMLWEAAPERREMVSAYPRYSEFRLRGEYWEGRRYSTDPFERLGHNSELIVFDRFSSLNPAMLALLSATKDGKTPRLPPRCLGILCDGDFAFANSEMILVPVKPDKPTTVIVHFGYYNHSTTDSSVWGFSLHDGSEYLEFMPTDVKEVYRCRQEEVYHQR